MLYTNTQAQGYFDNFKHILYGLDFSNWKLKITTSYKQ